MRMLAEHLPAGSVLARDQHGHVRINLGAEDGVKVGDQFIVVRGDYIKEREEVIYRKISKIEITEAEHRLSHGKEKGRPTQMGDRILRVYKPVLNPEAERKQKRMWTWSKYLIGGLLLLGAITMIKGRDRSSPPTGVRAFLVQQAPGDAPVIRVKVPSPKIPQPWEIFLHVIHRREGVAWFNPTAETIIDVIQAPKLYNYDDDPAPRLDVSFDFERQFMDEENEQDTYTVDGTYNDFALLPGTTYFYRLWFVTDPDFPPGTQTPEITSQGVGANRIRRTRQQEPGDAEFNPDRPDVVSQASKPVGPVTYILPPTPIGPPDGDTNQTTTEVTFSWQPSDGATDYRVDIFPGTDPGTMGNPIFQSPAIQPASNLNVVSWTLKGKNLQAGEDFYWRVGARKRGEASPVVDSIPNAGPYVYSRIRRFTTAIAPPPPP